MATIAVTRRRTSGPGVALKTVQLGVEKVYSKIEHAYVIQRTHTAIVPYGFQQVTWDNVHKEFKRHGVPLKLRGRRRSDDLGGDFYSIAISDDSYPKGYGAYRVEDGYSITTYDGGFAPYSVDNGLYHRIPVGDMSTIGTAGMFSGGFGWPSSEGPAAWKKFKPKLYVADMGQFVGEIRETLPMLRTTASVFSRQFLDAFGTSMRHQKQMSKKMSDQWLNLQFGWRPFVSDLVKFFTKFGELDKRLQQCIRDNGKDIRRKGLVSSTFEGRPDDVEEEWSNGIPGWDTMYVKPFDLYNGLYRYGYIRSSMKYVTKHKTWFSACFRYWVPEFDSPEGIINTVRNYARMFGIRITPTLIWNLTPWSWLADWVGNVGDNIDNFTTQSDINLTAKYAYLMKTITGEIINDSAVTCGGQQVPGLHWRRGFTVKTRMQASQFGFDIEPPNFSAKQWSILAALGIMRLH